MLVSEGLVMLEIPQPGGFMHPVLLIDDDGILLVDTGLPQQEEILLEKIRDAGFDPAKLSHILITHHDIDHIGGLRELHKRYPAVQVLAHQIEIPFIDGNVDALKIQDMERDIDTISENKKAFLLRMKAFFPNVVAPVDFALFDKDVLNIAGGVDVIFTPGHTLGHICLYHRRSKTLIAGDALNMHAGHLSGANREYTHDLKLANESIKRLEDFDIQHIITYHGGLFSEDVNLAIKSINDQTT
jgi:glyoxylase-like metal-dependent hydrolase (beta-lactamase superfamily II)